jgi:hypothetical protein
MSSSASAANGSVTIGPAQLTPEGAVNVSVTVVCDPGFTFNSVSATVLQSSGHKFARGTGFVFAVDFIGFPCTGNPQTELVPVQSSTSFAFKQGRAEVSASFEVFGDSVVKSVGPIVTRLR